MKTKKNNQFSQVNMMENSHLPNLELRHFLTLTLVGTGIMASAFRLFNAASIPLGIVRVGKPPTGTKCSSGFGEWRISYALCVFLVLLEVGARHFAWCVFSCVFRSTVGARHLVSRRCCIWFAAGFFLSHVFFVSCIWPKTTSCFHWKIHMTVSAICNRGAFRPPLCRRFPRCVESLWAKAGRGKFRCESCRQSNLYEVLCESCKQAIPSMILVIAWNYKTEYQICQSEMTPYLDYTLNSRHL